VQLLIIHAGQAGGRTARLLDAVVAGAREAAPQVSIQTRPALSAVSDDLLAAEGVLLGTPEHFGYMAGALKDFFDRTYYPVGERTVGLPYALFVSAGNDGTGTCRAVERIATGYRWKAVADPLIVVGMPDAAALERCRELGATMAAGLEAGVF
jgi:NAD(P)H-dependent FMN reductase